MLDGRSGRTRRAALVLAVGWAASACGTDYEGTQQRAADDARSLARSVERQLEDLVTAGDAPREGELLTAVRQQVTYIPDLVYVIESRAVDDGVRLRVAFDGTDESGGGGTYYRFVARLCVEYRIVGGRGAGVTVEDASCPEELLNPRAPTPAADGTVSLDG